MSLFFFLPTLPHDKILTNIDISSKALILSFERICKWVSGLCLCVIIHLLFSAWPCPPSEGANPRGWA